MAGKFWLKSQLRGAYDQLCEEPILALQRARDTGYDDCDPTNGEI